MVVQICIKTNKPCELTACDGTLCLPPITQRTYSEQDLLDVWDAAYERCISMSGLMWERDRPANKEEFFKQKFGIEIK